MKKRTFATGNAVSKEFYRSPLRFIRFKRHKALWHLVWSCTYQKSRTHCNRSIDHGKAEAWSVMIDDPRIHEESRFCRRCFTDKIKREAGIK